MTRPAHNQPSVPLRGLPEHLPDGETLLWQGAPDWRVLIRRMFRFRALAIYFGIVMAWTASVAMREGTEIGAALLNAAGLAPLAVAALVIFLGIAWLIARTTVYTVTDKRIVLRIGMALPISINLPFSAVESASLRLFGDGAGDLPLKLKPGLRLSYAVLWPHVRPFRIARPEPMLRGIADAARVAEILGAALAADAAARNDYAAAPASNRRGRRVPAKPGAASLASSRETAAVPG